MTPSEFKAWFEGFTEAMDGRPTAKQWARVVARVSEVDDVPISYPVYDDRFVRPYREYWWNPPVWGTPTTRGHMTTNVNDATMVLAIQPGQSVDVTDMTAAMNQAGRAEYRAAAWGEEPLPALVPVGDPSVRRSNERRPPPDTT